MLDKNPVSPKTRKFVTELYQAIDAKSVDQLETFLGEDLRFQLGNFGAIQGKSTVLDANAAFFTSIKSMTHSFDGLWESGDNIICTGQVHYVRLDDSELTIPFATVLQIRNDLIQDYQIYVDISPL
ncbi:nuclear transport factor 2 family protein [Kiloniella antarctica]|uniref:Nuclear transport factor 2 family protein n=1 Tax=Kiloniella antarctica TaxID=1550907 RepID=A0ABW5BM06_9PROT